MYTIGRNNHFFHGVIDKFLFLLLAFIYTVRTRDASRMIEEKRSVVSCLANSERGVFRLEGAFLA